MATVTSEASNIRLANSYTIPVWVVNSDNMEWHYASSHVSKYGDPYGSTSFAGKFDTWDPDLDNRTEAPVPINSIVWGEQEKDGHLCIIDPFKMLAWEMSWFRGIQSDDTILCSTFNIWDLMGSGAGDPDEGTRWTARGGRGSGFPEIAGLIRPEELAAGEIRHALAFIFSKNRSSEMVNPPAARTDGRYSGSQYPAEGMLFQLDPALTDSDFNGWGLTREAKIVARALQAYGMYDSDNGGAMVIQPQLLDRDKARHRAKWDSLFPGFYSTVDNIPSSAFRVINTGPTVTGGAKTTVVTPLILPLCGNFESTLEITMQTPTSGAEIRYTTDGSDPASSSQLYTGPFSINSGMTIKAKAFKDGMAPSGITRAPFTRNGTADVRIAASGRQELEVEVWPNPLSTSVDISVRRTSHVARYEVRMDVFNIAGKMIASIKPRATSDERRATSYTWHALGRPTGVYYCRITCGNAVVIKKLLLVR
jgi:hypothetical protein